MHINCSNLLKYVAIYIFFKYLHYTIHVVYFLCPLPNWPMTGQTRGRGDRQITTELLDPNSMATRLPFCRKFCGHHRRNFMTILANSTVILQSNPIVILHLYFLFLGPFVLLSRRNFRARQSLDQFSERSLIR